MKLVKVLSTAILFSLPWAFAPAVAQEHREQEKQPQQKHEQQQIKPAQQQPRAEQKQQAKPAQQQPRAEQKQQAKPAQQQQRAEQKQQANPAQQQQRAEHRQQAQAPQQQQRAEHQQQGNRPQSAMDHGRIPDDRFRASFGRGHTFHVNRASFAGRSRRFQYGGYWFDMVNPWPMGWLYTDEVYVDYMNGGYFLCDPVHPGVFLSINIG